MKLVIILFGKVTSHENNSIFSILLLATRGAGRRKVEQRCYPNIHQEAVSSF